METERFVADYGWLASLVNFGSEDPEMPVLPKSPVTNRVTSKAHALVAVESAMVLSTEIGPDFKGGPESYPFLTLPGEIREQVYMQILTVYSPDGKHQVVIDHDKAHDMKLDSEDTITKCHNHRNSHLAILQTCRQVFAEAWHWFYQLNTLVFLTRPALYHFLKDIGESRRNQIRSVRCKFDLAESVVGDPDRGARFMLSRCQALKSLQFVMLDHIMVYRVKKPFKNFRGLEDVVIDKEHAGGNSGDAFLGFAGVQVTAYVRALTRPRKAKPVGEWNWSDADKAAQRAARRCVEWDDSGVNDLERLMEMGTPPRLK